MTVPPPLAVADEAPPEPFEQKSASPIAAPVSAAVPEPVDTVESTDVIDAEDSLSCCVDGLTLLPVRCPHHDDVEVACDAHGTLHAVAMAETLPALLAVQAWLRSHAELVDMACPEAGLDTKSAPRIHACTDDARSVMGLLDAEVELHLLVTVEIGGRSMRCGTPLS